VERNMKYLRVELNLIVVAFVALSLDAFLHRDPYVRLPHGYSIGAISAGSPCILQYAPWDDDREYSEWRAMTSVARKDNGSESVTFLIVNLTTIETLEFGSEQEWESQIRARNAEPSRSAMERFRGITKFGERGPLVIGDYDDGFFLLDTAKNSIESFSTKDEWSRQVAAAGMSIDNLANPKSWAQQTREPLFVALVGGFALLTLPWVLRPLWVKSKEKKKKVKQEVSG
jgi:hypothetical protein